MEEKCFSLLFIKKNIFSAEIVDVGTASNSFDLHSNLDMLVNTCYLTYVYL